MTTSEESMTTYAWGEAQSARTFALIGFIFFAIGTAGIAVALIVMLLFLVPVGMFAGTPGPFFFFLFVLPFVILLPLSIGLTIWAWVTLRDTTEGRIAKAQTPSLVLGILGLFVNIVSGIFFILAYVKLASAIRYSQAPPPGYRAIPVADRYCTSCGRAIPQDAQYCPHCGKSIS